MDTGENPSAEEIQSKVVNDVDVLCVQVIPLPRYLDSKLGKYAGTINVGTYVELVRNRTRVKVATAHAVAEKKRRLQEEETKYNVLWRRLAEEVELQRSSENTCESLRIDIEFIRCATIDLRNRLETSQVAFNEESQRVDEHTADSEKKYHAHASEAAAKVKALTKNEAART